MPRHPRIHLANVPTHVVQRGHNRCPVFLQDVDFRIYRSALSRAIDEYECILHAYALMTNHVHLLLTPTRADSLPHLFMSLGSRYSRYFNLKYTRSGTLWGNRYYASQIQSEAQLMRCYRYIDLNPVRAGLVATPDAYRWSSFRNNGHGHPDSLVMPHDLYLGLGRDDAARRAAYRELCRQGLEQDEVAAIRRAWKKSMPLI